MPCHVSPVTCHMRVSIYSLKRSLYEGDAKSLNCRTAVGEITVLPHHRPLITILEKGTITVKTGNEQAYYFPIAGGFLEVQPPPAGGTRLIVEEA